MSELHTAPEMPGAGDLVFRTETHVHTHYDHAPRGGSRISHSTSVSYHGFLRIERVADVEELIVEVLLNPARRR